MIFSLNFEGLLFALPLPPHKKESDAADLINAILEEKREEPFAGLTSTSSTNIPIAAAREITRRLSRLATPGITRVALFYRMEQMRTSSADALLKLIEEPPADTLMLLTAPRPESLLPTIQSRARKIRLNKVNELVVKEYLQTRYELSESRVKLIVRLSDGLPGRAIDMALEKTGEDSSQRAVGLLLFKSLVMQELWELLAHMNELLDPRNRSQAEELLVLWQSLMRDCSAVAQGASDDEIVNLDFAAEIKHLSPGFSDASVIGKMLNGIKITLADLRRNVHIQGALSALAIRLKHSLVVG